MPSFRTSTPRTSSSAAIAAVAALASLPSLASFLGCGGHVEIGSTSNGGAGGDTGAGATFATTTSTTTSTDASTGGSGGLPEAVCDPFEAALVMATSSTHSEVSYHHAGTWAPVPGTFPPTAQLAAYVDVYGQLSAYWIGAGDDYDKSHFLRTVDGSAAELHDVLGWAPHAYGDLFSVDPSVLVGRTDAGTSVAYFDPDAFDFYPWGDASSFAPTSAAASPAPGAILLVGVGDAKQLCDIELAAAAWGPVHCRPDVAVALAIGGEIGVTPPKAVALPSGDVVVVFYTGEGFTLSATVYDHAEKAWLAPVPLVDPAIGIEFDVTATATGDVMVVSSSIDHVTGFRFSQSAGWSKPIPIFESNDDLYVLSTTAAAPGICGDDAWIAYATGQKDVRVARVRGQKSESTTVLTFGDEQPYDLTFATRPSQSEL